MLFRTNAWTEWQWFDLRAICSRRPAIDERSSKRVDEVKNVCLIVHTIMQIHYEHYICSFPFLLKLYLIWYILQKKYIISRQLNISYNRLKQHVHNKQ